MIVVGHHLGLGYPHGLESFPVEDVYRTSLVHEGLLDGESIYIDRYHHRVVLLTIFYALKVLVHEGDGWHPWSKSHRVYLVYLPQVLLSGVVAASSPSEATSYSVDNLPVTSSVGLPGRVVPSGGSSLASCRSSLLSRSFRPHCGNLVRLGGSAGWGGSRSFLTNRRRCPAWISSSILSFRA